MPSLSSRRIFIVDDHPTFRKGLRGLLARSDSLVVVGDAGSGEEALAEVEASVPDLVIVDIALPGINGIELTRRLKTAYPHVKVLILSTHADDHYVKQAKAAGASGYVLKDKGSEIVDYATRRVLAGQPYFCQGAAASSGR